MIKEKKPPGFRAKNITYNVSPLPNPLTYLPQRKKRDKIQRLCFFH